MANIEDSNSKSAWSTWEELLLASAVRRHGTKKWNSVAMEIQNRRPFSHPVTPQICKQKFRDLQQRFSQTDEIKMDDERPEQDNHGVIDIPWLDELRNLRVEELRRELQRSDLLIVSLQLKVKKLEEERDLSLKEKENPDLETKDAEKQEDETKRTSSSENRSENRSTGDESDRESKSNLTDSKGVNQDSTIEIPNAKPLDHSESGTGKPDLVAGDCSDEKAVDEVSCNGSSDTMTKEKNLSLTGNSTGPSTAPENGDLANFHDSMGESKESSDLQSSVSLSNKRRKRPIAGNCSGEELETDEVSPLSRRLSVKSQPLASFLETIRLHETVSLFERLLEIQESSDYRKLIRQHVDMETVKTRLEGGQYSGNNLDFFRDLLLIFNNAVAFFPKASAESLVAVQLRRLVSKEVATKISKAEITMPRLPPKLPPLLKSDTDVSISVEKIGKFSGAVTCKKRSSITGKKFVEEKPDVKKVEDNDNSIINSVENLAATITKKRTAERLATTTRGARSNRSRTSNASSINKNTNPNLSSSSKSNPSSAPSPNLNPKGSGTEESSGGKTEKKLTIAKKRSAANFLNRMKRSYISSNGTLLDTLKNTPVISDNRNGNVKGGDSEVKKGIRGEPRKEVVSRQRNGGKIEKNGPAKRTVGRPPKRTLPAPDKKMKEVAEVEECASKKPKKRARR